MVLPKEEEEDESASADAAAAAATTITKKNKTIILMSNDDQRFELTARAAALSVFVRDAVECEDDADDDNDDNESPATVPVPRVRGAILHHVVTFLNHHADHPMPEIQVPVLADSLGENIRDEWYERYITSMDRKTVFEIVSAANFMVIKELIDLACLFCSFELAGKTADEIRDIMNFPPMTAEEEEAARIAHPWVFE